MEHGSLLHGHRRIRDAAVEATRKPPNPQSYFAEVSGRDTIQSQLMHISNMLAIAKTLAINPKEPAMILKTEHEDAPCDEGYQAHRQSV
jgi:hypothetical protein